MTKIKNTKKGMAKKTLSMSLVVAMLATSNVPVWAAEFSDDFDAAVATEAPVTEFSDNTIETPAIEEETTEAVVEDTTDNTAVATAAEGSSDSFSVTPEFTDNANNAIKDNAVTWGTTVKAKFKVTAKDNKAIDSNIKFHYAWKVNGISTFLDGLTGMILAITIALGVWLYFQRKELRTQVELNERCIKEQTGQYHLLYEKQQELRRFRHDSSAHLQAIASIAEGAGDQRVLSYVSELMGQQAEMKHLATGNLIGDAVVNAYYSKGLRDGIHVELVGQFSESFDISETALCVIFTNVIANAYEAALRCKEDRSVRISFTNFRDHQFIRVQNPTSERPVIEDGIIQLGQTTKADKENHGLGVRNILDAVKHAGGQVQWNLEEQDGQIDVFTEIQLPIHPDTVKN